MTLIRPYACQVQCCLPHAHSLSSSLLADKWAICIQGHHCQAGHVEKPEQANLRKQWFRQEASQHSSRV